MINKRKILTMTKLAEYRQDIGEKDLRINEFFLYDYVTRKNVVNCFFACIGTTILLGLNYLFKLVSGELNIFELNYQSELTKILFTYLFVIIVYCIIGFFKYGHEYNVSQKRVRKYTKLLESLDEPSDN